jgi:hypothetical protein
MQSAAPDLRRGAHHVVYRSDCADVELRGLAGSAGRKDDSPEAMQEAGAGQPTYGILGIAVVAQFAGYLVHRPRPRLSHLHRLLRHPYYVGIVLYQGVLYEGKHERLVEPETWQRVQELLIAKHLTGEPPRPPALLEELDLLRAVRLSADRLPCQRPRRHLSVLHLPRSPAEADRLPTVSAPGTRSPFGNRQRRLEVFFGLSQKLKLKLGKSEPLGREAPEPLKDDVKIGGAAWWD